MQNQSEKQQEIQDQLIRIRRTISESEALIAAAELRIAETDRLLEANGLTREEVLKWHPTREQRLAVNEELRKQGLPPIEEYEALTDFDSATEAVRAEKKDFRPDTGTDEKLSDFPDGNTAGKDELGERQRKFNNFMRDFRL